MAAAGLVCGGAGAAVCYAVDGELRGGSSGVQAALWQSNGELRGGSSRLRAALGPRGDGVPAEVHSARCARQSASSCPRGGPRQRRGCRLACPQPPVLSQACPNITGTQPPPPAPRPQAVLDAWYSLWQWVFQPALGVLMLGAVSGGGACGGPPEPQRGCKWWEAQRIDGRAGMPSRMHVLNTLPRGSCLCLLHTRRSCLASLTGRRTTWGGNEPHQPGAERSPTGWLQRGRRGSVWCARNCAMGCIQPFPFPFENCNNFGRILRVFRLPEGSCSVAISWDQPIVLLTSSLSH